MEIPSKNNPQTSDSDRGGKSTDGGIHTDIDRTEGMARTVPYFVGRYNESDGGRADSQDDLLPQRMQSSIKRLKFDKPVRDMFR